VRREAAGVAPILIDHQGLQNIMRKLLLAAALLALAGCAATGPGIEPGQVTVMQKGKTTFNDVVRQFGKPSLNSKNMDGTRTAIYLQPGDDEPGAVVSLMTAISGTKLATRETVTFEFDEKDVLTDYRWKQATPAQAPSPAAAAQPYPSAPSGATQPAAAAGSPSATPGTAQPTPQLTQGVAGKPVTPATTSSAPRPAPTPAPAKKRSDGLPGWLPSGNYDPRDPFR
jgi:outer membrane protein assembly factor BamE (lipoprotein component of BamABCDE complex)